MYMKSLGVAQTAFAKNRSRTGIRRPLLMNGNSSDRPRKPRKDLFADCSRTAVRELSCFCSKHRSGHP